MAIEWNSVAWINLAMGLIAPTSLKDKKLIVKKPTQLEGRGKNEHAIEEKKVDNSKVEQHHSNDSLD